MAQHPTPEARRDAVTAVHSIHRFAISVPDLEQARHFFTAFGLEVRDRPSGLELHTADDPLCWASVHAGSGAKRLEYLSFAVYESDLAPLLAQARAHGAEPIAAHPLSDGQGVWLRDPDGIAVQIVVGAKRTPAAATPLPGPSARRNALGVPVAPARSQAAAARPRRLSHLLLFCTDVPRSLAFYSQALGLRLSDRSQDLIAFSHGAHSSDHHLLAWVKSEAPGLHHSSWTVDDVDQVGAGMEQMIAAGYREGWGVGRHVIGSNYFYYARDPWGSFAEFTCGIDYIDARTEWPAGDHPPEDSFYLWGPPVPDYFTINHEARP